MSTREEKQERAARLVRRAIMAMDAMTPDQRAHHRHEQRISFAAGNLAMDWTSRIVYNGEERPAAEVARELVRAAAGPCPCGDCTRAFKWRGHAYRRDADGVVRRHDIATGVLFSGEVSP